MNLSIKKKIQLINRIAKSNNIRHTCEQLGVSKSTYYRWKANYENLGSKGLEEKSRKPHHSPNAVPDFIYKKVIKLARSGRFQSANSLRNHLKTIGIELSVHTVIKILETETGLYKYVSKRDSMGNVISKTKKINAQTPNSL